jgi:hypothetical protein
LEVIGLRCSRIEIHPYQDGHTSIHTDWESKEVLYILRILSCCRTQQHTKFRYTHQVLTYETMGL